MAQYVISGRERRRRWSLEEKRSIVMAAFVPGAVVSEIARRADVCVNQIYRWRQDLDLAPPRFAEMVVVPERPSSASVIEIDISNSVRVRIPADVPAGLASAVVAALSLR